jgi:hypothetical protein
MKSILAMVLLLATGQRNAPPELLQSINPNRQTPVWVALSKAVTSRGELSTDYLDQYALRDLHRVAKADRNRVATNSDTESRICFGERPAEIAAPSDTLADLSANAQTIVQGKIVQRTLGFFEDRPAALLTVRIDRQLHGDGSVTPQKEILVYYPEAEFRAGDDTYCIRPATHPARPRVGDQILVFAYLAPIDTSGRLIYGQASKHLVFETAAGQLVPPVALRRELEEARITTLDQLFERVSNPASPRRV